MASKTQKLFSEIEQSQVDLRESIEHSRVLVERTDALIRQVKDRSLEPDAGAYDAAAAQAPPAPLTPPR